MMEIIRCYSVAIKWIVEWNHTIWCVFKRRAHEQSATYFDIDFYELIQKNMFI